MVMMSCSPALFTTVQVPTPSASTFARVEHGGLIQFNGLYARSSACTDTEPSALVRISRVAIGRCAESLPT